MSGLAVDPAMQMTVRIAVSLLFAWAAIHKLRDVAGFRAALASYELLPRRWAGPGAGLLIAIESGIGIGLWLPGLAAVAGLAAAGLLALYAGAMAINLVRGRRDIDCGCSGIARARPLSGALVVRNGILLIAPLLLALPSTARPLSWLDAVTIGGGAAALALLYAAADGLLANAPRSAALTGDHRRRRTRVDTALQTPLRFQVR